MYMKRLILLAMTMLPMMAMAQLPHFAKLAEKYNGAEGVTAMSINKQMIALVAGSDASLDFVDDIQILLSENANIGASIIDDAKKAVKKSKVEELMSANEDGATYTIYTKREGSTLSNLIIIVENDTPSGFIVITGDIPEEKLNEVIKVVNM